MLEIPAIRFRSGTFLDKSTPRACWDWEML